MEVDREIDAIFEWVDVRLHEGRFGEVDEWARTLDVSRATSVFCVVVLTATLPAREHLPARTGLVDRCRGRLSEVAPGRVESLLRGLA